MGNIKKLFIAFLFAFFIIFSPFNLWAKGDNILGILLPKKETYYKETLFSEGFVALLEEFGANVILIDYNEIVNECKKRGDKCSLDDDLRNFLKQNKIKKVIIAGNHYNFDLPPYAPNNNRFAVTESLVKMAKNKDISLMGICGGMQGILKAEGLEISNITQTMKVDTKISHNQNYPINEGIELELVLVDPSSSLAKILSKHNLEKNEDGWFKLYLPHLHSEAFNSVKENNVKKLKALNYKIIGISLDGIVEIVEDGNGNIHFQSHPEMMVVHKNKVTIKNNSEYNKSIEAVKEIISNFATK